MTGGFRLAADRKRENPSVTFSSLLRFCLVTLHDDRHSSPAAARAAPFFGGSPMPAVKELHVNGTARPVEADPARTLLSVLRDDCGLTGAKYGCGEGLCGACTVVIDGRAVRSCSTRVESAAGKKIST